MNDVKYIKLICDNFVTKSYTSVHTKLIVTNKTINIKICPNLLNVKLKFSNGMQILNYKSMSCWID